MGFTLFQRFTTRKLSTRTYKTVTHALFDMDGLLLNTEHIYQRIIGSLIEKHGGSFTPAVKAKILGRTEQDLAKIAVNEAKLSCTPEQFLIDFEQLYTVQLPKATLMPGAERLIRHLHKSQVPFAIATSSSSKSVDVKVKNYKELFSLFQHFTCATSDPTVKRGKPFPDVFLVCASRFSPPAQPEKCLVFEDSPNGIRAADSAGMQSVLVPDYDVATKEEIETCPATIRLPSLEDFKPEIFGLPQF